MTEKAEKTIMVIDDDDVLRDLIKSMLIRMNYNVVMASTGDEAIRTSKEPDMKIDAAILDLFLPDTRGDKICPEIRENHPGLKVILMSGYGLSDTEFLNVKTDGFIQKPCSYHELEEALEKAFSGS